MSIRIDNLSKWTSLLAPATLTLDGDYQRNVAIEVNCPSPTRFDYIDAASGEVTFLAIVQGRETIIFDAPGAGKVTFDTASDEVWVYTVDGDGIGFETFEESLAGLENRRERNPELERMLRRSEANVAARLAVMQAALDQAVLDKEFRVNDNSAGATGDTKPADKGGTTGADANTSDGVPADTNADQADGKARTDANGSAAPAK